MINGKKDMQRKGRYEQQILRQLGFHNLKLEIYLKANIFVFCVEDNTCGFNSTIKLVTYSYFGQLHTITLAFRNPCILLHYVLLPK